MYDRIAEGMWRWNNTMYKQYVKNVFVSEKHFLSVKKIFSVGEKKFFSLIASIILQLQFQFINCLSDDD